MAWITYIYWIASLVISITAFTAGWRAGLSAAGTSLLSIIAGAGLRGSLYGTKPQKVAGFVLASILISIAYWLGQGFSAHLFGFDLTGSEWGLLGFGHMLIVYPKMDGHEIKTALKARTARWIKYLRNLTKPTSSLVSRYG